ncbi:MAG: hypothetical protein AABZ55_12015 [Bdellovibrionota bacterium]
MNPIGNHGQATEGLDPESSRFLTEMAEQERVKANRFRGVRTVLVVLSATGIVFDLESLRQKILLSYPDAAVFFLTTRGSSVGTSAPQELDLVIDFTGPKQRQGFFFAKRIRGIARFAVGRKTGFFRKRIYDRILDEKKETLPTEMLERERSIQRKVLALAGVAFMPMGDVPPDRGKITPLDLPPMQKL